jgi:FkbM family methyltransferase
MEILIPKVITVWRCAEPPRFRKVRRFLLASFSRVNPGDITIKHPYTHDKLRLHSFRHKGYWFHRKRREAATMRVFSQVVQAGDTVVEVGGHIGFVTMYFVRLVGPSGTVIVFEPGENNLPYLRANTAAWVNITIIGKAVGQEAGSMTMYLEDLTGQNNSLVPDYEVLRINVANAIPAHVSETTVEVVTLDDYFESSGLSPDLVKIDVEGFEYEVLLGARRMLESLHPVIMVEVTRRADEVFELLREAGYQLFRSEGQTWFREDPTLQAGVALDVNTFCLHAEHHQAIAARLGWRFASLPGRGDPRRKS